MSNSFLFFFLFGFFSFLLNFLTHRSNFDLDNNPIVQTLFTAVSATCALPNLLELSGEGLLAADDDGEVVGAVDDLDAGAWDLGPHRVAALDRQELVAPPVVHRDVAPELIPHDVQVPVDLARAAADDVVQRVPGSVVSVAEEPVH